MTLDQLLTKFVNDEVNKYKIYTQIAQVISVDEDNMSAQVSFVNQDADKTVRLGATVSEDDTALGLNSLILLPVVDSFVLVTFINNITGFISAHTDVSKILLKVGDKFIQLDEDFLQLLGDADNAVRFAPLDSNLQSLVSSIQCELVKIATGIAAAGGSYTPGTLSLDIDAAKIDEIKTN